MNRVVIALCALLSGADDFVAITDWAHEKKKWLAKFLDLSAGIPSHDRFNTVLGAINPHEFQECLLSWITALHELTEGQVVAIDGKTLRRSFDAASSKAPIHMVSAWATVNQVSLGQVVASNGRAWPTPPLGVLKTTGLAPPRTLPRTAASIGLARGGSSIAVGQENLCRGSRA